MLIKLFHQYLSKSHLRDSFLCASPPHVHSMITRKSSRLYHRQRILYSDHTNFLSEGDFHRIADRSLDELHDLVGVLEALELDHEVEVTIAQGVLKLDLGKKIGTWVINKQTPNRQLWWSSPISGPKRYEYDQRIDDRCYEIFEKQISTGSIDCAMKWYNTKDKTPLLTLLREEIKNKVDVDIAEK